MQNSFRKIIKNNEFYKIDFENFYKNGEKLNV